MALITPIQTSRAFNTSSATTLTHAFPSSVSAGSLLLVCGAAKSSSGVSNTVTDTQGNTYTTIASYTPQIVWWYTTASSSGACSVTITQAGGSTFMAIGLIEIPAGSYSVTWATFDTGFSTSVTTDPFTVTVDGAALFALLTTHAIPAVSITEDATWTLIGENTNDTYLSHSLVWTNKNIGTHTHTWSVGASTLEYHSGVVIEGVPDPNTIIGSHVIGADGTVTTTRTGLINLDGVTRSVAGSGIEFIGGTVGLIEQATAPAGIANTAIIYAVDDGAGKTRWMVQFPTGSAQQLSVEI
jgi:hypothetical protein